MKLKTAASIIVTLIILAAVALYLIALDNRYKQINGVDYFDIWTLKKVKGELSGPGKTVVEYPLLKTQYQIEDNPEVAPPK